MEAHDVIRKMLEDWKLAQAKFGANDPTLGRIVDKHEEEISILFQAVGDLGLLLCGHDHAAPEGGARSAPTEAHSGP